MKSIQMVFFVAAMALAPAYTYAQDCSLDKDETDAFTNEHIRAGSNNVGSSSMHWKMTLKQTGDKYGWELVIKYNKQLPEPVRKGDPIFCKLDNGKIVRLVSDNDYPSSFVAFGDGVVITTLAPKGEMSAADMQLLADFALSEMRAPLSGKDIEPKISSKQGKAIQEIAKCLMKK